MKDVYSLTDRVLLVEMGQKIKRLRISEHLSQKQLSEQSGLSVFSISQIENGSNPSVLSLLMLLRALGCLEYLSAFWADEPINPIALIDYEKTHPQRQRVGSKRKFNPNTESEW